jgi:preprotein translocase subunit SecB
MSNIKYTLISSYIKQVNFNFINEKAWIESQGKLPLSNKLGIINPSYLKISENNYKVDLGLQIKGELEDGTGIFESLVIYSGVFNIEGYEENELEMFININCASFLFPYARAEMMKLIAETNLPKINIQPVDFVSMYYMKQKEATQ